MNKVSAVIVAAGSSSRMMGIDKQLLEIDNVPVIIRSTMAYQNSDLVDNIVIVSRIDMVDKIEKLVDLYKINKVSNIVIGGENRAQSVINGIKGCGDCEYIVIHDGARPFISNEDIENTIKAAFEYDCAALAKIATDTIKIMDDQNYISSTVDRNYVCLMQTPQVFKKSVYIDSIEKAQDLSLVTDDCMLLENAGYKVKIVEAKSFNLKITTPVDIDIANAYIRRQKNG